jgi:hypothetical protein
MQGAGHVACVREKRRADRILVGKPEDTDYLGNLGADGKIILKQIRKK